MWDFIQQILCIQTLRKGSQDYKVQRNESKRSKFHKNHFGHLPPKLRLTPQDLIGLHYPGMDFCERLKSLELGHWMEKQNHLIVVKKCLLNMRCNVEHQWCVQSMSNYKGMSIGMEMLWIVPIWTSSRSNLIRSEVRTRMERCMRSNGSVWDKVTKACNNFHIFSNSDKSTLNSWRQED